MRIGDAKKILFFCYNSTKSTSRKQYFLDILYIYICFEKKYTLQNPFLTIKKIALCLFVHIIKADWIDCTKSVCQYLRQELYVEIRTGRHSLLKTLCDFHCLFLWYRSLCKRAS